jgi:hypothetical protein
VEADIVLFRKFLELSPSRLNVVISSRRFRQRENGITIVWGLLKHCERLVFCIGEPSYCQITTGQPDPIFNVVRIQHAGISQKWSSANGRGVIQPHCSDSFESERVSRIQLQRVEIAELGFVIITRFKIPVGFPKKARLLGLLGTGSDQRDR